MTNRVPLFVHLPLTLEEGARRALSDSLREHALQINWATGYDTTAVASSTAVAHDFVAVDATASAVTVSLIPAVNWRDREIRIKKTSSNTNVVIVSANGAELIDDVTAATLATAQFSTMRLISDGAQWWKV